MKRILAVLPLALALAVDLHAQSGLAGKWEEPPGSRLNAQLTLQESGTTITGTFTVRARPTTITNGKVTKNTFTFSAAVEGTPEGFSGVIDADQVTLWRDRDGKGDAVTLRRVKPILTGKWEGQTPNGMSLSLDLVAKDQALSGTLSREGEATPISEGAVTKDGFTFKATLGGETETIAGTVEGDQITAWLIRQGPERAAVLKRVK